MELEYILQYRHKKRVLIVGILKKVALILGNPHAGIEFRVEREKTVAL